MFGNHRIISGGYTIGPSIQYLLATVIMVVVIGILILKKIGGFFWFFSLIFFVLEIFLILKTGLTEPGIVPARSVSSTSPTADLEQIVNGVTLNRKWCLTCRIHRPSRGKHCSLCNCCVDKFDHHCTFLSNCIGIRNYRYFILMLLNSTILALLILLNGIFQSGLVRIGFISGSVLTIAVVGNMLAYHLGLIAKGTTSYEEGKRFISDDKTYPYSLGGWRINFQAFFYAPIEASKFSKNASEMDVLVSDNA